MPSLKGQKRFLSAFLLLLALCFLLIVFLSGFQHETKKFKALLITIYAVLLFGYIIADTVYFILRALYGVYRERKHIPKSAAGASGEELKFNRGTFLQLRLKSLRSSLLLTERHRDEAVNLKYKEIERELWLFLRYFLLLLFLVVYSRDPLAYYNTHIVRTTLSQPIIGDRSVQEVSTIADLYDYIEHTLIESFNEASDYDSQLSEQPGWIRFEIAKLLGTVRLRQLRYDSNKSTGLEQPEFEQQSYMPRWQLPFKEYHYMDKYMRTYGPWLYFVDKRFQSTFLLSTHKGDLHTYTEGDGYVALLARNYNNSMQILNYLQQHAWLDVRTAAVFIDFTLFNIDSNLFSVCSLMLEQTPFGDLIPHVEVQSCELLMNLEHLSFGGLLLLMLYILQMIQFTKVYVQRVWHEPHELMASGNILDALIILLNLMLILLVYQREVSVQQLLLAVEAANKQVFLDFRIPAQLDYLGLVFFGLLICCATLRIWKILQFASLFRIFTYTLHIAKWPLLSATLIIVIVLCSFGVCACLINGANSVFFIRVINSFTAAMSVSLGIGHDMSAQDLSYGGSTLGVALYAILILVVFIVLINMFITLLIDNFAAAKERELAESHTKLNFLQFLAMEHAWIWKLLQSNCCKRKESAIYEQVQRELDRLEQTQVVAQQISREEAALQIGEEEILANESAVLEQHEERLAHLSLLSTILATQVELLDRKVTVMEIETDSSDEDEQQQVDDEQSSDVSELSKNGKRNGVKMKLLYYVRLYSRLLL